MDSIVVQSNGLPAIDGVHRLSYLAARALVDSDASLRLDDPRMTIDARDLILQWDRISFLRPRVPFARSIRIHPSQLFSYTSSTGPSTLIAGLPEGNGFVVLSPESVPMQLYVYRLRCCSSPSETPYAVDESISVACTHEFPPKDMVFIGPHCLAIALSDGSAQVIHLRRRAVIAVLNPGVHQQVTCSWDGIRLRRLYPPAITSLVPLPNFHIAMGDAIGRISVWSLIHRSIVHRYVRADLRVRLRDNKRLLFQPTPHWMLAVARMVSMGAATPWHIAYSTTGSEWWLEIVDCQTGHLVRHIDMLPLLSRHVTQHFPGLLHFPIVGRDQSFPCGVLRDGRILLSQAYHYPSHGRTDLDALIYSPGMLLNPETGDLALLVDPGPDKEAGNRFLDAAVLADGRTIVAVVAQRVLFFETDRANSLVVAMSVPVLRPPTLNGASALVINGKGLYRDPAQDLPALQRVAGSGPFCC